MIDGLLCFCSSRRRHTSSKRDWSSDVCSSDLSVAIKLRDNAQVVNVDYYEPTNENRSLLTISRQGYAVRYDVADVPVTGIRTAGVRAINLKDDDQVADQILVKDGQDIAVITQRGAFKEMPVDE